MAGTKKPRRKYRPKPVDFDGFVGKLVTRMHEAEDINSADPDKPAPEAKRLRLVTSLHSALESIGRGNHPGEDDWRLLSDAVNLVETMIIRGNLAADECTPVLSKAVDAMVQAAERYRDGKAMRMDGLGLQAMREVIGLYEMTLEGLPERESLEVMNETQRRVRKIQQGIAVDDRVVVLL